MCVDGVSANTLDEAKKYRLSDVLSQVKYVRKLVIGVLIKAEVGAKAAYFVPNYNNVVEASYFAEPGKEVAVQQVPRGKKAKKATVSLDACF
jgi:hypothetical protein